MIDWRRAILDYPYSSVEPSAAPSSALATPQQDQQNQQIAARSRRQVAQMDAVDRVAGKVKKTRGKKK